MNKLLIILLLAPVMITDAGSKYLEKISAYQNDSYFKEKVYAEKEWRDFYSMKEPQQKIDAKNYDLHLLNAAFFYVTNKLREEKGFKQLQYSKGLRDAAIVHTDEMVQKNFFDHYNKKDKALYSPDHRIKLFVPNPEYTGENCVETYLQPAAPMTYLQLAEKMVDLLYKSPSHKAIMMNKGYKYLGVAAVFEASARKDGATYVKGTQDFCSNN